MSEVEGIGPGAGCGARGLLRGTLLFGALSVLLGAGIFIATLDVHPVVRDRGRYVNLPDGVYYMVLAREFWGDGDRGVYRLETQKAALSRLFGRPMERSLPANVFPPAFLVLLPFALIENFDVAYCAWVGVSLAALIGAAAVLRRAGAGPARADATRWAALGCVLVSAAMGDAILCAQTTIIQLACLILLLARCRAGWSDGLVCAGISAGSLIVLAMKPQFLAIGVGLLLIERRYREVVFGIIVVLFVTAILGARIGVDWVREYGSTLQLYQGAAVADVYGGAFARERMNIFGVAFSGILGMRGAAMGSWCLMGVGFCGSVMSGVFRRRDVGAGSVASRAQKAMMASYLLFSPHSGRYEEIMAGFVVAADIAGTGRHGGRHRALGLLLALGVALLVNRAALGWLPQDPLAWWVLKAVVLTGFVVGDRWFAGGKRRE